MSRTIKLQINDWNGDASTETELYSITLSPYNTTDGIQIDADGWYPQVANDTEPIDEVFTLSVKGSSMQDVADKLNRFEKFVQYAQRLNGLAPFTFETVSQFRRIWLYVTHENCDPMRAAVISIQFAMLNVKLDTLVKRIQVTIRRAAKWERTSLSTVTATAINGCGGTFNLTGAGAAQGRIHRVKISTNAGIYQDMYEAWIGIHNSYTGLARSAFVPVWSLSDGYYAGADTTQNVSDSSAFNAKRVTVTFATVYGVSTRIKINYTDKSVGIPDQYGRYLVLLRAKKSIAGMGARVRLGTTYTYGQSVVYNPYNYIMTTEWQFYPLGYVDVPFTYGVTTVNEYHMQAGLYGGAGSLYMDCLVFIPVSDGLLHITTTNQALQVMYAWHLPGGRQYAMRNLSGTGYNDAADVEMINWGWPFANLNNTQAQAVIAVQGQIQDIGSTYDIEMMYAPSYLTLRGTG